MKVQLEGSEEGEEFKKAIEFPAGTILVSQLTEKVWVRAHGHDDTETMISLPESWELRVYDCDNLYRPLRAGERVVLTGDKQ